MQVLQEGASLQLRTGAWQGAPLFVFKKRLVLALALRTHRKYKRVLHSDADLEHEVDKAFRFVE